MWPIVNPRARTINVIACMCLLLVSFGTTDIGDGPGGTGISPTSPSPAADATPFVMDTAFDYVPWAIPASLLIADAHLAITGRVVEILPARWSTADRQRPADPYAAFSNGEAAIFTPAVITLDGPPLVNRVSLELPIGLDSGAVVVALPGGIVGPDSWVVHLPDGKLSVGERVLIVLNHFGIGYRPDQLVPTEQGLAWSFVDPVYELTDTGMAVSYANHPDGPIAQPTDQLIADILAAAAQLPTINPTPPVVPTSEAASPSTSTTLPPKTQ